MTAHGDGVYKSIDAGKSWVHLGLEKTQHISRIIIHPKDPNILERGLDRVKDLFSEAPIQTPPLGNTPMPIVQTARANVNPNTNLTRTQQALLSPEEQVIASRRT